MMNKKEQGPKTGAMNFLATLHVERLKQRNRTALGRWNASDIQLLCIFDAFVKGHILCFSNCKSSAVPQRCRENLTGKSTASWVPFFIAV